MPTAFDASSLDFENKSAAEVLKFARDSYGDKLVFAFGGTMEDVAILHLAQSVGIQPNAYFIDTGRHYEQSLAIVDETRRHLKVGIQWLFPDPAEVASFCWQYGATSMPSSPDLRKGCCEVRRIHPIKRLATVADAIVFGARRAHSNARTQMLKVGISELHAFKVRVAPLADWTWPQVVQYVQQHGLPVNELYRKSFTSIGCAPCTRGIQRGELERAGRWPHEPDSARERGAHISGGW